MVLYQLSIRQCLTPGLDCQKLETVTCCFLVQFTCITNEMSRHCAKTNWSIEPFKQFKRGTLRVWQFYEKKIKKLLYVLLAHGSSPETECMLWHHTKIWCPPHCKSWNMWHDRTHNTSSVWPIDIENLLDCSIQKGRSSRLQRLHSITSSPSEGLASGENQAAMATTVTWSVISLVNAQMQVTHAKAADTCLLRSLWHIYTLWTHVKQ